MKRKTPISIATSADFNDRLALIARLYYIDGLGQIEVAKLANVSQAKVSRLLSMAKERGIVQISVAEYEPRHVELEKLLRRRFSRLRAIVIRTETGAPCHNAREAVGYFAAPIASSLITNDDCIAIAGGRTIHELVRNFPENETASTTVVQAMGNVDANTSVFDAQEVGRILTQRLGGTFLSLNTPAFVPDKKTKNAIVELEQVRKVHKELSRARIAFVGIGTLSNSLFIERGTFSSKMIRELETAGAIGEICGRFINAEGIECATAWRDRVVSVSMEQLRAIPLTIAVVAGTDRSPAILAAIRGKIVKGLIIDDAGARALLDYSAKILD